MPHVLCSDVMELKRLVGAMHLNFLQYTRMVKGKLNAVTMISAYCVLYAVKL
jgi:hypothetical protein